MALCTTAQVKEFLGITGTDDDTLLARLITSAQGFLERECNREFDAASHTEKFDGDGDNLFFVQNIPLRNLTSVTFDGTSQTLSNFDTDEETGEIWIKETSGIDLSPEFPKGRKNIVVVYDGGFANDDAVPEDLVQACIGLVSKIYNRNREAGVKSQKIGDFSVTYDNEIVTSEIQETITKYQILNV